MKHQKQLSIRLAQSLAEVPAAAWDACAAGDPCAEAQDKDVKLTSEDNFSAHSSTREKPHNPFVSHDFFSSLEASHSVGGRSGWQPRHLLAEDENGLLVGAAPCYVKSHSRGEYVFDHGWADAFERAGGSYYPKLQVAVPFTPVTGPRPAYVAPLTLRRLLRLPLLTWTVRSEEERRRAARWADQIIFEGWRP